MLLERRDSARVKLHSFRLKKENSKSRILNEDQIRGTLREKLRSLKLVDK